jgi:Arc/MetJ-type ribon-helix-helix transcriptional regulator
VSAGGQLTAGQFRIRLEPELRAALTARAQTDHTNASEVIRQALRAWLDVA